MTNREIDKLVHIRIMGYKGIASRYTEDTEHAFWMVDYLLGKDERLVFHTMSPTKERPNWYAGFGVDPPTDKVFFANADTREKAICLAALKYVGVEIKEGD